MWTGAPFPSIDSRIFSVAYAGSSQVRWLRGSSQWMISEPSTQNLTLDFSRSTMRRRTPVRPGLGMLASMRRTLLVLAKPGETGTRPFSDFPRSGTAESRLESVEGSGSEGDHPGLGDPGWRRSEGLDGRRGCVLQRPAVDTGRDQREGDRACTELVG